MHCFGFVFFFLPGWVVGSGWPCLFPPRVFLEGCRFQARLQFFGLVAFIVLKRQFGGVVGCVLVEQFYVWQGWIPTD